MAIRARFVGKKDADGLPLEYHPGIPAADLSDEQYEALSKEDKALVRSSLLYTLADKPAEKGGAA